MSISWQAWLTKKALPFYFSGWAEETIAQQRVRQEKRPPPGRLPAGVCIQSADADGVPAEWTLPTNAANGVILYLHGGGYCLGSPAVSREFAARLAQAANCRTLSAAYRLAPEHPFPAAVADATAAYRWLLTQGTAPADIVIMGDSAGGGLALATLLALRDAGAPPPAGAVCISPWVDLALTGDSIQNKAAADPILSAAMLRHYAAAYAGETPLTTPLLSPLYADLHGLPPLLIQVGTDEILRDDATRLAERARQAGVAVTLDEWPGLFHVFPIFAFLPESEPALARIAQFVAAVKPG